MNIDERFEFAQWWAAKEAENARKREAFSRAVGESLRKKTGTGGTVPTPLLQKLSLGTKNTAQASPLKASPSGVGFGYDPSTGQGAATVPIGPKISTPLLDESRVIAAMSPKEKMEALGITGAAGLGLPGNGVIDTLQKMARGQIVQPVEDKQTDTGAEKGFYALGAALGGDQPNTILGGLRYNAAKGVQGGMGVVEGLIDWAVGGLNNTLSTVTSLGGTKPNAVSRWFDEGARYVYDNDIAGAFGKGIDDEAGKLGWAADATGKLYNIAGGVLTGIGAGKVLSGISALPVESLSRLTTGLGSGGQSAQQAYNEGASPMQAGSYGNAAAALEIGVESLAGGIPGFGKGVLDDIIKGFERFPAAARGFLNMLGEGGEEALTSFVTPYLQRIFYNPEAKNATVKELLTDFAYGAALSG
ncbi:MAG: hypothetical protein AAGU77_13465, partial [Bacillota bacterium]